MEDIRVLQFGTYFAGPLAGRMLAGMGCRVTYVRRPDSCRGRSEEKRRMGEVECELHHKHESCVELDLPSQLEEALHMVSESDVIVENFGPGVMDRLGLGYERCSQLNPRVVYLSLQGFASSETRPPKAYECMLLAMSGVFRNMGLNRTLLGVEASFTHLPLASVYGAFHGVLATLCAIHGSCKPVHVTVPLASALSETMVHNSLWFPMNQSYMNPRQQYLHEGKAVPVDKSTLMSLTCPFFRIYWCADGAPIYLVCPAHAQHQLRALKVLDIEEEVLSVINIVSPYAARDVAVDGKGIGSGSLSVEQSERVCPIIATAFKRRPAAEWERLLAEAGVPVSVARTKDEWDRCLHAKESGLMVDGHLSDPVWFNEWHECPPPAPSSDVQRPHPLSGLKVLDLCNVIAGPTMGTYLARMGADVVKIDPTNPTYSPEVSVVYGIACNVGKRSVLLDIHKPDGRQAFDGLVAQSDVVLVNCTEASLVRLGLTPPSLRAVNPRIVLVRFDAWGGPNETGPMKEWIGYDDCVQSGIGIMNRFGGQEPEEHAHIGTIDVIAGVCGAIAAVAAVIWREKSNRVCVARCSLASVGQYLQLPFMSSQPPPFMGFGIECTGEHALHSAYRTADGEHVFIMSKTFNRHDHTFRRMLLRRLGVARVSADMFASFGSDQACSMVRECGGEACVLKSLDQVRNGHLVDSPCTAPTAPTYQFLVNVQHPVGTLYKVAPHCIRGLESARLDHAPKYGSHTQQILSTVCDVQALLVSGSASIGWSRRYMPFSKKCDACQREGFRLMAHDSCSHAYCPLCNIHPDSCPVCNTRVLGRAAWNEWKSGYSDWRRGRKKGARGEWKPTSVTIRRTRSF